ncbi:uncharacterized protein LOC134246070 [Saccostrea cucullata]|uniref:uncharacterized protein LOC134246070 n=1 Tax=Saccostrea cuccullata TaxID=36930 RepID=UPI002ECFC68C
MNVMSIESSTKIVKFMVPGSGVLVLGWGSIDYIVKMPYFFENLLLCSWVLNTQTKHIVMMSKSASSRFVNFMVPGPGVLVVGRGSIDNMVKMHYFFENLLLCSWVLNKQIKHIVMMSKSASSRFVNFMAPGSGVLVLGQGSIDYIVKMHYFFENLLLCSWVLNTLNKHIIMMSKSASSKIVNFMAPGSGVLVLERGSIDYIVKMHYFCDEHLLCSWVLDKLTKHIVKMSKSASSKIVNFMAPGSGVLVLGWGSIDNTVKMHYFFENILLCSWVLNTLNKHIVMMSKSASSKIVNFMAPGSGVLVLGWGSIDYIVKMHYFLKIFFSAPGY